MVIGVSSAARSLMSAPGATAQSQPPRAKLGRSPRFIKSDSAFAAGSGRRIKHALAQARSGFGLGVGASVAIAGLGVGVFAGCVASAMIGAEVAVAVADDG